AAGGDRRSLGPAADGERQAGPSRAAVAGVGERVELRAARDAGRGVAGRYLVGSSGGRAGGGARQLLCPRRALVAGEAGGMAGAGGFGGGAGVARAVRQADGVGPGG